MTDLVNVVMLNSIHVSSSSEMMDMEIHSTWKIVSPEGPAKP